MKYFNKECTTKEEINQTTNLLSKAKLVDLKFDDGGVTKNVENYKGIYNYTQGKYASTVVPYYNIVQHKDYFDAFATALDRLNIKFTMKIQEMNNRAFADIEFKDRNLKFDKLNEEFTTGIRLVNSYDKSTGLHVMSRYTRLACTNGMILTRSENTVSVKHVSKIVQEIERFVETKLHQLINENNELNNWVSESMKDSIEWQKGCLIIAKLFEQIKHREEILKRLNISIITVEDKKKKKHIEYVLDEVENKKQRLTRWDMYNAITNYLTFGEQITPHIENICHKKAEKILKTKIEKLPLAEVV